MNHITQVKRALKDLLIARLPIMLQQADVLMADGVVTPPPAKVWTTDKGDLELYPALEIVAIESEPRIDSVAQEYRHRLAIGVSLTGSDEETMATQVERYVWALRRVLRDQPLPEVQAPPMETGNEEYIPLTRRPQGLDPRFVKGGFMEVLVVTVE